MDLKTVFRLQIITLSDSICFGLIYAFINPYLLVVGGDHLTVGIFSCVNLLCQHSSADFVKLITGHTGKQFSLFLISVIATISYLLITLTSSCWFIIFSRCIFTITNQANSICKDLVFKKIPESEAEYFHTVHNVLSSCGFLIGPIITGCLFSYGFSYSCLLAAILTSGNIWISTTLTDEEEDEEYSKEEKSIVAKRMEDVTETIIEFKKSNIKENWDLIILKFSFLSSITIFFTKFTQILKYNFNSDPVAIGCTTAYMNALVFACPYLVDSMREKFETSKFSMLEYSLSALFVSLLSACYAPSFLFYLGICFPLILSRCYLNNIWGALFAFRQNESLNEVNKSIGLVVGLIIPIFFGIVCNQIEHHAVVLFSVTPGMLSLLIYYIFTVHNVRVMNGKAEGSKNKDE